MNMISVAMATFNGARYIQEQLESILIQTIKPLEIIIVDDASTDNIVQIIKEYQLKHNNIKLIENNLNQGVTKSFELAIDLCQGEFIALADQDDVWVNDKLEKLYNNIEDSLLIHSDAFLTDKNLKIFANSHMKYSKSTLFINLTDYLINNNITGCCTMFRRSFWELIKPIPNGFYVHDHYLAIMASFYHSIKYYPYSLVYYRQHTNNAIGARIGNYDIFIKKLQKVRDSIAILKDNIILSNNQEDIAQSLNYYDSILKAKLHNVNTLFWVFKHVTLKKFLGFIVCSLSGKRIARFIYNHFLN